MRFCPADGTPLVGTLPPGLLGRGDAAPDEVTFPRPGEVVAGRYRVVGRIGFGGMGAVFRVEHLVMGKPMALKMLHPRYGGSPHAVRRFEREAQAASMLDHAHVCMVTDFGVSEQGLPFLVMELLKGADLFDVLRDVRRLPAERAVGIGRQITQALADAHAKGVVHRDLKPENVFLCSDRDTADYVKVLDFGIAKLTAGADGPPLTAVGALPGTPECFSPEQAAGRAADHRSDLYTVGLLLYRMVTGFPPFTASGGLDLLEAQIHDKPMPIASFGLPERAPRGLEKAIMRLLHKNPDRRFQSAGDLIAALDRVLWGRAPFRRAPTEGGRRPALCLAPTSS